MTDALPLLDYIDRYPCRPAFKARETSAQAAEEITSHAATIRNKIYTLLKGGAELTADECADLLNETVLTTRPRVSELNARRLIVDTGQRRRNESGKQAIVWRIA